MAAFYYCLFGLRIRSNAPLPLLLETKEPPRDADCEVCLNERPEFAIAGEPETLSYASSFEDKSGQPALRIWKIGLGDYFRLDYSDGHQFWIDRKGTRVWATWPASSSIEEVCSYLMGPVLGILLRYRGAVCLHASAVAISGKAVAFVGPPGAGKSTMAAALSRRGFGVLADDIATIEERDGEFYVRAAYPRVCLWPDSVELIYGKGVVKGTSVVEGDKLSLSAEEGLHFESGSLPLDRVYILSPILNGVAAESAALKGERSRKLFLSLVANTYATNILDARMRADEFRLLGKMASRVRIYDIRRERGAEDLEKNCDWIAADEVLG